MGRASRIGRRPERSLAAAVLASAVASAAARPATPLPCPGRYVVLHASRALVAAGGIDGVVVGTTTVTLGSRCAPSAARAHPVRHGWRIAARAACTRVEAIRVRLTSDCTLLRGTLGARGRFTAVTSTCGDGILDPGAGEQCDDGNVTGGDGCDEHCLRCAPGAPPLPSTWAAIEQNVFGRYRCTGCHGPAASGGLELLPDVAYDDLVGVPSVAVPALPRVAPGNARASLLWLLLAKGTGAPGYDDLPPAGMPIGGRLAPDDLDAVARWIDGGAPRTGVVPGTEPLLAPCPP